ncbi:MAG: FG-GAP-like repeat-containing protein, partial [Planctomycetota bacterium]
MRHCARRLGRGLAILALAAWAASEAPLHAQHVIDLATADPDVVIYGEKAREWCGYHLASGDVNGDGWTDAIVSAVHASEVELNAGQVYVFFGNRFRKGVDIDLQYRRPDLTFYGDQLAEEVGRDSGAGDLDGDGIDDIVVPIRLYDHGDRINAGGLFLMYGRRNWVREYREVLQPDVFDLTIVGAGAEDGLGRDVEFGDFNGDGRPDLAVTGYRADFNGVQDVGAVYVFYGRGARLPSGTLIDLAHQPADIAFYGPHAGAKFGITTSFDDIDGDGIDDLIVGADGLNSPTSGASAGGAFVFRGGQPYPNRGVIDLTTRSADLVIYSDAGGNQAAYASDTGDFNGDGHADIALGGRGADPAGKTFAGATWIVYGGPSLLNGQSIDLALTAPDVSLLGGNAHDELGRDVWFGDINGDGLEDLLSGAFKADPKGRSRAGVVYVVYGRRTASTPWVIDLSETKADLELIGGSPLDSVGARVRAGDFNDDGEGDLLLSAFRAAAPGRPEAGQTYLFFSPGKRTPLLQLTAAPQAGTSVGFRLSEGGPAFEGHAGLVLLSGTGDGRYDRRVPLPGGLLLSLEADAITTFGCHLGSLLAVSPLHMGRSQTPAITLPASTPVGTKVWAEGLLVDPLTGLPSAVTNTLVVETE